MSIKRSRRNPEPWRFTSSVTEPKTVRNPSRPLCNNLRDLLFSGFAYVPEPRLSKIQGAILDHYIQATLRWGKFLNAEFEIGNTYPATYRLLNGNAKAKLRGFPRVTPKYVLSSRKAVFRRGFLLEARIGDYIYMGPNVLACLDALPVDARPPAFQSLRAEVKEAYLSCYGFDPDVLPCALPKTKKQSETIIEEAPTMFLQLSLFVEPEEVEEPLALTTTLVADTEQEVIPVVDPTEQARAVVQEVRAARTKKKSARPEQALAPDTIINAMRTAAEDEHEGRVQIESAPTKKARGMLSQLAKRLNTGEETPVDVFRDVVRRWPQLMQVIREGLREKDREYADRARLQGRGDQMLALPPVLREDRYCPPNLIKIEWLVLNWDWIQAARAGSLKARPSLSMGGRYV